MYLFDMDHLVEVFTMIEQKYIQNKQDFQDLKHKLEVIKTVVQAHGSHHALKSRIADLSKSVSAWYFGYRL